MTAPVPGQDTAEWLELGPWVKRQRIARQQNGLTPERLGILADLGFEFGEEAQMTEDWEWRFDSLVELLLMRARALSCCHACAISRCHACAPFLSLCMRPLWFHACISSCLCACMHLTHLSGAVALLLLL